MIINIETIMKFFESEARTIEFPEVMQHFEIQTRQQRSHLRSKLCKLVRQEYLIQETRDSWRFNYAMRNICPCLNNQTGRDSSNPSL